LRHAAPLCHQQLPSTVSHHLLTGRPQSCSVSWDAALHPARAAVPRVLSLRLQCPSIRRLNSRFSLSRTSQSSSSPRHRRGASGMCLRCFLLLAFSSTLGRQTRASTRFHPSTNHDRLHHLHPGSISIPWDAGFLPNRSLARFRPPPRSARAQTRPSLARH
jgi:hypothetical protein